MKIQIIPAVCIVTITFVMTSVQSDSQMEDGTSTTSMNDGSGIKENLQNLFDSMAKSDTKNSQIYHQVLKEDVARERHAFDAVKEQIQVARNRNRRNLRSKINIGEKEAETVKRQVTQENNGSSEVGVTPKITGPYIDEHGFYRDPPEVENLRYDRVHTYRGLLIKAQERLVLCKALMEDIIIDWEILRDEGIVVKDFDTLVNTTQTRVEKEIAHVDTVIQVDPRTAKIVQPVDQSSVDEISQHFQDLARCLHEQKPEEYARDRFEEIIYRIETADDELIDTFRNVTTSIDNIKRRYNV